MDIGSSYTKTKSWENCSAFVHFQNGTCLPKPLGGKFSLIPLVLHNENVYCAVASPRLERTSLLPGKTKGKGGRPALAQSTVLQHNTLLSYTRCAGKTKPLETLTKPPPKWDWLLRAMVKSRNACYQWTAGRKRGCSSSQIKNYSNVCELKITSSSK